MVIYSSPRDDGVIPLFSGNIEMPVPRPAAVLESLRTVFLSQKDSNNLLSDISDSTICDSTKTFLR